MAIERRREEAANKLRGAAGSALEGTFSATLAEIMKPGFLHAVSGTVATGLAAGAGAAIASLLVAWVRGTESVANELKAIEIDLEISLSKHLLTGIERACFGYRLRAYNSGELSIREERLGSAIDELEKAWIVSKAKGLSPDLLFMISMVQGLCFIRRNGGRHAAEQCFDRCRPHVRERLERLRGEMRDIGAEIEKLTEHLPKVEREASREPVIEEIVVQRQLRVPIRQADLIYYDRPPYRNTRVVFDPVPYQRQADTLRQDLKQATQRQAKLQNEIAGMEKFRETLSNLHLTDLAAVREGIQIDKVVEVPGVNGLLDAASSGPRANGS